MNDRWVDWIYPSSSDLHVQNSKFVSLRADTDRVVLREHCWMYLIRWVHTRQKMHPNDVPGTGKHFATQKPGSPIPLLNVVPVILRMILRDIRKINSLY